MIPALRVLPFRRPPWNCHFVLWTVQVSSPHQHVSTDMCCADKLAHCHNEEKRDAEISKEGGESIRSMGCCLAGRGGKELRWWCQEGRDSSRRIFFSSYLYGGKIIRDWWFMPPFSGFLPWEPSSKACLKYPCPLFISHYPLIMVCNYIFWFFIYLLLVSPARMGARKTGSLSVWFNSVSLL